MQVAELEIRVSSLEAKIAERDLKKLGDTSSWLEGMLGKLAAAAALVGLGALAKEAALLAARYETMGVVMDRAGNNAGYTARQMRELEIALQDTGISMLESRNVLTQLATAHIDLSKATELGRGAQNLAVVAGINSSEAFQKLVHGIKSGQTEVLRTLDLNVQFEEGYKRLAKEMGTTTAALSGQQKMSARVAETMKELTAYNGIYEDSMDTAGKQAKSMERYLENLKLKMGEVFQPVYSGMITALTKTLKDMLGWVDRNKNGIDSLGLSLENTRLAVADLWTTLAGGNTEVKWFDLISSAIKSIGMGVAFVADGIRMWGSVIADVNRRTYDSLLAMVLGFQQAAKAIGHDQAAKTMDPLIVKLAQMANAYGKSAKEALGAESAVQRWMKANREVEKMAKDGKFNPDGPSRLDIAGQVQIPETETNAVNKEAAKLIESLQEQIATFGMGKTAIEAYKASMAGLNNEQTVQVQGLLDQLDALGWQQQRVDDARKAEDELTAALEAQSRARIDLLDSQRRQLEEEGRRLTEQMMSPAEKQIADLAKLDAMLKGGVIGWETYNRRLQEIESTGLSVFSTLLNGIDLFAQHGADAFTEMAMTGKFAWKNMINSIIADLIRLQSQKAFTQLGSFLMSAAGKYFSAGAGGQVSAPAEGEGLWTGYTAAPVGGTGTGVQSIARPGGTEGSNVSITVNLGNGGGSTDQANGDSQKGLQLGTSIKNAVLGVIADEQRPGGLLYGSR